MWKMTQIKKVGEAENLGTYLSRLQEKIFNFSFESV